MHPRTLARYSVPEELSDRRVLIGASCRISAVPRRPAQSQSNNNLPSTINHLSVEYNPLPFPFDVEPPSQPLQCRLCLTADDSSCRRPNRGSVPNFLSTDRLSSPPGQARRQISSQKEDETARH